MANTCFVNHCIQASDNDESINELNKLAALLKDKEENSGEYSNPLWEALKTFYTEEELSGIKCRSTIYHVELSDPLELQIDEETAWNPMNEAWNMLMNKFPLLKRFYVAEEFGCCIYETNDPDKDGQVILDACLPANLCGGSDTSLDYIYEIFENEENAKAFIESFTNSRRFESLDDAQESFIRLLDAEDDNNLYFSLHVCEYVEV